MSRFNITDNDIYFAKRSYLLFVIPTVIISSIIMQIAYYFVNKYILKDFNIYIISLIIFLIIISITVFFSIKLRLKYIEKSMENMQYIIENEKFIITQNGIERYNISKDGLKYIKKYSTCIIIVLKEGGTISISKYLDGYYQLIKELFVFLNK